MEALIDLNVVHFPCFNSEKKEGSSLDLEMEVFVMGIAANKIAHDEMSVTALDACPLEAEPDALLISTTFSSPFICGV